MTELISSRPHAAARLLRRLLELAHRRGPLSTARHASRRADAGTSHGRSAALWTASMAVVSTTGVITVFHAAVAGSAREYGDRLVSRIGEAAMPFAVVNAYDEADPLPALLLSPPLGGFLRTVAENAGSPISQGFELYLEHRMGG